MTTDGYDDEVHIPSVLISHEDGSRLIAAVEDANNGRGNPVLVELAWDVPRGEYVVMDFWMDSGSRESSEFLLRFKDCAEALKYRIQFVPHYHVFSLPDTVEGTLCVDGYKHCAPDPDADGQITGADVTQEDVRQLCLWKLTAKV